jgi:hypothetical protein
MAEQKREPASPKQSSSSPTPGRFNRDQKGMVDPFSKASKASKTFTYPESLATVNDQSEHTHWIAFYPLVREGTSAATALGNRATIFETSGQQRVDAEHATAAGAALGGKLAAETLGTAGLAGLKSIMGAKGGLSNFFKSGAAGTAGTVAALGIAAGVAAGAALNGIGARRLIMGSKAIVLGIQDKLSYGYSANYDVADIGGFVGAAATGNFSGEASLGDVGTDVGALAARKLASLAGAIGGNQVTNLKEATSKTVENPYKEQLFKNMGFRKFGFEYKFAPRTYEEGLTVFGKSEARGGVGGIIGTFLEHMHPEPSNAGVFLIYPSEFLIVIYHKSGAENTWVRRISNCALTGMNIDYGADGFTTFQGTSGMPTEATIRLEFTELETLTNKRSKLGY